jgi:hypothetical protein
MGLTIHYNLQANTRSANKARELVEQLRQKALDLPFKEVSEVVELAEDNADIDKLARDHPHRWLLIQAQAFVVHHQGKLETHLLVKPERVIGFTAWPGEGCEEANFGLAVYPRTVEIEDQSCFPPRTKRLRTGLAAWSWGSFCKTQYASNPDFGGVEHFLRCHLAVVKVLDHAAQLGILKSVSDEGDYWEKRDLKALAAEVGEMNTMIGGWAERLKQAFGDGVLAEIDEFHIVDELEATTKANLTPESDHGSGAMFKSVLQALTVNNSPEDAQRIIAFFNRLNRTETEEAIDGNLGDLLLQGMLTMTWDEDAQEPVIKSELHKLN